MRGFGPFTSPSHGRAGQPSGQGSIRQNGIKRWIGFNSEPYHGREEVDKLLVLKKSKILQPYVSVLTGLAIDAYKEERE